MTVKMIQDLRERNREGAVNVYKRFRRTKEQAEMNILF